jgi:hypothetical protein
MPSNAVHFADGGARLEQRAIDILFLLERQSCRRQRQQRGAAAGYQTQHQVICAKSPHCLENALRAKQSGCIGHRMRGLENLDVIARYGVTVTRDHNPGERPWPVVLHGARHCGGSFARAHDDQPAARHGRKMRRNTYGRLCGGYGGIEHPAQQNVLRRENHALMVFASNLVNAYTVSMCGVGVFVSLASSTTEPSKASISKVRAFSTSCSMEVLW